jgi:DNA transformation protein
MPVSADFLEYVKEQFKLVGAVETRRMFGGAGIYLDGRMFALVDDDTLYLKTTLESRGCFVAAGQKPFEPWAGHVMDYYTIPDHVLESPEQLKLWADGAIHAARAKAARPKRARKPARKPATR